MADLIGTRGSAMDAAQTNYMNKAEEFMQALNAVKNAAMALGGDWKGGGYGSFDSAIGRFHQASTVVVHELENIAKGVGVSKSKFETLDTELTSMWNGYGG